MVKGTEDTKSAVRRALAITAVLLSSLFVVSSAVGQEAAQRELRPLVTLGGDIDAPLLLLENSKVALLPSVGRILVAPAGSPTQFVVFDLAGNLLSVGGREGQGPGEMEDLFTVRSTPDGFLLIGDAFVQVHADGAVDGRVSIRWAVNDLAVAGRDSALIGATAYEGERVLLVSTETGDVLGRYFPPPPPAERTDDYPFAFVSRVVGGRFVAAESTDCSLHEIDLDGRVVRTVAAGSWCRRWEEPYDDREPIDVAPRPQILDVRLLNDGSYWIVGMVADEAWRPGPKMRHESYDTLVEMISPSGDRRTQRLSGTPMTALEGPFVATRRQDAVGVVAITVWGLDALGSTPPYN